MVDTGSTAFAGMVVGGAAGYVLSDGDALTALLGAGAGWAVGGPGIEDVLMEPTTRS